MCAIVHNMLVHALFSTNLYPFPFLDSRLTFVSGLGAPHSLFRSARVALNTPVCATRRGILLTFYVSQGYTERTPRVCTFSKGPFINPVTRDAAFSDLPTPPFVTLTFPRVSARHAVFYCCSFIFSVFWARVASRSISLFATASRSKVFFNLPPPHP